jgi:hypothetical protein
MCSHTNYRAATVHDLVVPALGLTLTCTLRSCWTSLIDRLRSDADGTRPMAERCAVDVNASHDDTRSCSVGDNTLQSRESHSVCTVVLVACLHSVFSNFSATAVIIYNRIPRAPPSSETSSRPNVGMFKRHVRSPRVESGD